MDFQSENLLFQASVFSFNVQTSGVYSIVKWQPTNLSWISCSNGAWHLMTCMMSCMCFRSVFRPQLDPPIIIQGTKKTPPQRTNVWNKLKKVHSMWKHEFHVPCPMALWGRQLLPNEIDAWRICVFFSHVFAIFWYNRVSQYMRAIVAVLR